MLSIIKLFLYSLGTIYNNTYDVINGTFYPNHTDYITFIEKYNKSYNFDNYLEYHRNVDYIENMNKHKSTYELEINHLADIKIKTNHILKIRDGCYNCFEEEENKINIVPNSVDWREHDVVTHVKNQGGCGSCWAFSTTGSVEGAYAIKHHKLYNISEQQLVDCSNNEGNHGCMGGLMDNGFQYIIDNNGICSEDEYPYNATDDMCQSDNCNNVLKITNYSDVQQNNEHILKMAVAKQPVSVAIQANISSFQLYKRGIYQDTECGNQLDHGVLIVGYGRDKLYDLDYWIVKNSWGVDWGDNGYINILRNYKDSDSGMCGIAMQPSLPIV